MFLKLAQSPRFWAAILAVLFVLLGAFIPAAMSKLDQAAITAAVVALVAFIAADSAAGKPTYARIFTTPRFWALVVSLAFIFVRAFMPGFLIDEKLIQELIGAMGVTSVGVSYRPVGAVRK